MNIISTQWQTLHKALSVTLWHCWSRTVTEYWCVNVLSCLDAFPDWQIYLIPQRICSHSVHSCCFTLLYLIKFWIFGALVGYHMLPHCLWHWQNCSCNYIMQHVLCGCVQSVLWTFVGWVVDTHKIWNMEYFCVNKQRPCLAAATCTNVSYFAWTRYCMLTCELLLCFDVKIAS